MLQLFTDDLPVSPDLTLVLVLSCLGCLLQMFAAEKVATTCVWSHKPPGWTMLPKGKTIGLGQLKLSALLKVRQIQGEESLT